MALADTHWASVIVREAHHQESGKRRVVVLQRRRNLFSHGDQLLPETGVKRLRRAGLVDQPVELEIANDPLGGVTGQERVQVQRTVAENAKRAGFDGV